MQCVHGQRAAGRATPDRFEFVYTPKRGSWLNMAEIEINVMGSQCLDRRIDSIETLRSEVAAWLARRDNLQGQSQLSVHHQGRPREAQTPLPDDLLIAWHWLNV